MGMLGNCFRLGIGPGAEFSTFALLPGQEDDYRYFEQFINRQGASAVLKAASSPTGYYIPDVYHPPITNGEMSLALEGSGGLTSMNLYASRNMSVDMTGGGSLEAAASLVIAMGLAMTGSGSMSMDINGRANASIDFTGSGDLSADIVALGNMAMALTGTSTLAAAIQAIGTMSLDITVAGSGLTVDNVAAAVWDAVAANYVTAGTMGEIMNGAAIYTAKVILLDDDGGTADRYIVSWFKNGVPIAVVPTSPTIQVVKVSDGSDLVAVTAMAQIGSTPDLRYTATGANRIVSGAGYIAIVKGTIDASERTWKQPVGRDTTA